MSSYRDYRGQCIGRVLHFLHHYCGGEVASRAIISENSIEYCRRKIATYYFPNDKDDIPIFTFLKFDLSTDKNYHNEDRINEICDLYTTNQKQKMMDAILDQNPPNPCGKCREYKLKLSIYEKFRDSKIQKLFWISKRPRPLPMSHKRL